VAGGADDRCTGIIHLVLAQTEARLIMLEVFQRSLSRIELAALVVGMAVSASLSMVYLTVISLAIRQLLPNARMTGKA
jgi:hypothetical protein